MIIIIQKGAILVFPQMLPVTLIFRIPLDISGRQIKGFPILSGHKTTKLKSYCLKWMKRCEISWKD